MKHAKEAAGTRLTPGESQATYRGFCNTLPARSSATGRPHIAGLQRFPAVPCRRGCKAVMLPAAPDTGGITGNLPWLLPHVACTIQCHRSPAHRGDAKISCSPPSQGLQSRHASWQPLVSHSPAASAFPGRAGRATSYGHVTCLFWLHSAC